MKEKLTTVNKSVDSIAMLDKFPIILDTEVKCPMCGRTEHCNGAAGYPEGCFHPDYGKVKLSDKIEHATFTGNPSDETIKLVNQIADNAYNLTPKTPSNEH